MIKKQQLGEIIYSKGIEKLLKSQAINSNDLNRLLRRHSILDFGDIPREDKELNERNFGNNDGAILSKHSIKEYKVIVYTILNEKTIISILVKNKIF